MKRLVSVMGAVIILVTAILPAGATSSDRLPSANAGVAQIAFANWLVHEDGRPVMYFGTGMNMVPSAPAYSIGMIGRAPCRHVERHGHEGLRCVGSARGHTLLPGEFVVDPALNTATLTMESRGDVHSINWAGKGDLAEPFWHQHSGTGFSTMVMVMVWRTAKATGTLFGRSMPGGRGVMFEMANAEAWIALRGTGVSGTQIRFVDGLLKVRANF